MEKILIIEDDMTISHELKELLDGSGYEAIILEEFEHTVEHIIESSPNLVLLDINIPFLNGQQVLQNLRKKSDVPVIMVTSKNTEIDEVLAMSYGADDYITKPYNPTLLLLRISAVLKRANRTSDSLTYKDITVYSGKGVLSRGDESVELTKNEMIIFQMLLHRVETIVSRDDIMTELWNNAEYVNENTLTVNVSRLRGKLAKLGCENAIETKKGQGYMLV